VPAAVAGEAGQVFLHFAHRGLFGFAHELAATVFDGGEEAACAAVADGAVAEGLEESFDVVLQAFQVLSEDAAVEGGTPVGGGCGAGGLGVGIAGGRDGGCVAPAARVAGIVVAAVVGVAEGGRVAAAAAVEGERAEVGHGIAPRGKASRVARPFWLDF